LNSDEQSQYLVAVIGAGPAGLFAARQLAASGVRVALFNRDIKPGGLAEYGIYPAKVKMKEGLRKQFRLILECSEIDYYGNVVVGSQGEFKLEELRSLGFQALLVTVGAQGTKWLGLQGEDLSAGVYHAKDLVYYYNQLPPFSQKSFYLGRRVAVVGVGNVMMDIARFLIRERQVEQVIAVARRGPAEVKFDKKELEEVSANLDQAALDEEITRVASVMENIGQDVATAKAYLLSGLGKAKPATSSTRLSFDFLASPTRILGDERGYVTGLEVEETTLVLKDGEVKARGTGVRRVLDVDTVIFCIGDKVDESFGLPVQWNEFVKSSSPRYPVDNKSYEAFDPVANKPIDGVFVAGWSREASSGLVGIARKDGENGAQAVLQYLQETHKPMIVEPVLNHLHELFARVSQPMVGKQDVKRLEEVESLEAKVRGLESFKFSTNEEMLVVMGLTLTPG
jgi:ferredoxin--NADP+ reductase